MDSSVLDSLRSSHIQLYVLLASGLLLTYIATRIYKVHAALQPVPGIPLISLPGKTAKDSYVYHGNETINLGLRTTAENQPFQIMTGTGPKIVFRNRYADEIAKNKKFSVSQNVQIDFQTDYPGFEGIAMMLKSSLVRDTIVRKLTQSLGLVTEDLVEEATDSIYDIFGESPEWQTMEIKDPIQLMVSRLSSRVFLGKPLCRNARWLEIAMDYTTHVFEASRALRNLPALLRPIQHRFMKSCRKLRRDHSDARALIDAEVRTREASARALLKQGKKPPKKADTIGWLVEMAQEQGQQLTIDDLCSAQLGLTMSAIHSTSETTCQALQHLCEHPEIVQPLREEVVRVIGQLGWAKTSLYQLRLMDSFLKESQRFSKGNASVVRYADADVVLSDGIVIKKNSRVMLTTKFMDEEAYPDPLRFDAYRFMGKEEQKQQQQAQEGGDTPTPLAKLSSQDSHYVSPTPEHMGFGLGRHSCPGRFFVANELKIALAHLLLKYDWSLDPEQGVTPCIVLECNPVWNAKARLRFKRRKEEIELDCV